MSGAVPKADAQPSPPIGTDEELIERPYGAGSLKLACPGDQQDEPTWILRFSDPDCREQVFIGKEAEQLAWAAWNRYAPSYNCWLFQTANIEAADALVSRISEVERLREALQRAAENFERLCAPHIVGNDVHNFAYQAAEQARATLSQDRTTDTA